MNPKSSAEAAPPERRDLETRPFTAKPAPKAPPPAEPHAIASPSPIRGRRIKPLVSLRAHKFLALGVFIFVALAGLPAAWIMGRHIFYAEAVVHVAPRFAKNLSADQDLELQSNSQYREYVQQQVKTINRYDIVLDALNSLGAKKSLWQRPQESDRDAAERLAGALQVQPVPDTYLVTVGLEGRSKEGLDEIVNAVVDNYLEKQRREEFYESDKRIEALKQERKKSVQEIEQKSSQKTAISQEIGVTSFGEGFLNPYDELLIKAKEALDAARRQRIEAEAQVNAYTQSQKAGALSAVDAFAQQMVDADAGITSLKANLNIRRGQLLAKVSGLTADHPGRKAIERELDEMDAEIAKASDALRRSYHTMLLEQKQAAMRQAQRVEKDMTAEVQAQSAHAAWFAARFQQAVALGADTDRARKHLASIDDRVDYLTLESNAPGFVHVATRARPPEVPSRAGRKRTFAMFLAAALALGLVVPVGVDFVDPRIHAPNELEKALGFAPMGAILDEKDESSRAFAQDQLLRLAATIDRDRRNQGTRTFVLTAAKPGEGTTTTALQLACALEQIGVHAIVVEANTFRRDERYLYGKPRPGLSALLEHNAPLEEVIAPGGDGLPDRIAAGEVESKMPPAGVRNVGLVFDELLRRYQVVLVDTPPLLLSAETELLIGLTDATLLVVQAGGSAKGAIKRAARTLERLSPPVVGTILTRVRPYEGGGYLREVLHEYQSAKRLPASRLLSPWLWK